MEQAEVTEILNPAEQQYTTTNFNSVKSMLLDDKADLIVKHEYYESCGKSDCDGSCMFCTLGVCKTCGLLEGALTTECPGTWALTEYSDRIYDGKLDFKDGEWIDQCSPHSPAFYWLKLGS